MISSVRGAVLSSGGGLVVVEVGGVGLAVQVTPPQALALRIGDEARLHTALVVREDDLSLYGFATPEELVVFDLLRGVSGVGPKSALGVLATLTPEQVARAVADEDDAPFRKVSGIGPKTAKLIAVSLAGKLAPVAAAAAVPSGASGSVISSAVVGALVGLGWNERVAAQAVDEAAAGASDADTASVQALLRLALARLGPQQVRA
ncbi:Holliday junction branch migration protein RuvA [Pseudolysinimonas kribbensis]|uniref:Holliday junction branch migration complex subunit RuvA n=1 Tax=Pseudolysinimonas kribbensis TaxID=433641 RepID=A0ABQ6K989_9MICO|nr:Holliday junction branch migration protein RuvA [Pseudolysinimonas kribbensis]GMA96974.1 Holliday junction ATP-dependent DNA helicase RuvA [Pseudolysinimonas kribbensis]